MTKAQVSPNRKMFYRFKREKIKTSFIQLRGYSNVEKTKYLVEQPGSALSSQESVNASWQNITFRVRKALIIVALKVIRNCLFTLVVVL
jgi:hypothetical protein